MKILKPKDVAKLLNISVKTLQNWDNDKKLIAYRNKSTNRRFYTEQQINDFLGLDKKSDIDSIVIYARVSNVGQKDDLVNQIEFLKQYANAKGYIINENGIYTDIGSGLNYNRKNWNILLDKAHNKEINKIIIAHKDRFVRFGYDWFEKHLNKLECEIIVVNNEKLSPQEEMIQDLISIIHVFSCRIYGLRKYKSKIKKDNKSYVEKL